MDEKQKNPFASLGTKKLIEQELNAYVSDYERGQIIDAVPSFANKLMRLHGMKPPNAKQWKSFNYAGKGMLDIPSVIKESIKHGKIVVREKRRVHRNPEKPEVTLIVDISGSIRGSGLSKATMLLGSTFAELFGRGYAKSFHLGFIGSYDFDISKWRENPELERLPIIRNVDYEAVKRTLCYNIDFSGGTNFLPVLESLEIMGFYRPRKIKFVFLITDGVPEAYTLNKKNFDEDAISQNVEQKAGYTYDVDRTKSLSIGLANYLEKRWEHDRTLVYFWIQIGQNDNILEFILSYGYVPPEKELNIHASKEYKKILSDNNFRNYETFHNYYEKPQEPIYDLCQFYWKSHKKKNMLYLSINDLKSGEGFHTMMDYLLHKFKREIKIK